MPAIKKWVGELHAKGVKVLWPYNPWDTGTHRPEAGSDEAEMAKLLRETGADGFNGDTMGWVPESFYTASVAAGRPSAIEPEGGGLKNLTSLNWDTMGWGCGSGGSNVGRTRATPRISLHRPRISHVHLHFHFHFHVGTGATRTRRWCRR